MSWLLGGQCFEVFAEQQELLERERTDVAGRQVVNAGEHRQAEMNGYSD
ncbi:hypothetical protein LGT39_12410 [Demequina sp. TTPB684]|nr:MULTISPECIES: hypothetical protein [unclassified Demequina]MCB2413647.1 hypothetical protein [Demequina sp. TTPB684]UPU87710.1 hypothetical protein LGT36_010665 [Demequina sp. TMPB413]